VKSGGCVMGGVHLHARDGNRAVCDARCRPRSACSWSVTSHRIGRDNNPVGSSCGSLMVAAVHMPYHGN